MFTAVDIAKHTILLPFESQWNCIALFFFTYSYFCFKTYACFQKPLKMFQLTKIILYTIIAYFIAFKGLETKLEH